MMGLMVVAEFLKHGEYPVLKDEFMKYSEKKLPICKLPDTSHELLLFVHS